MAWTKVSEMKQKFNKIFKSVWQNLAKIFGSFAVVNKLYSMI